MEICRGNGKRHRWRQLARRFVTPEARGTGAADALFAALRDHAKRRDWAAVRWITRHFNERGRAFYDRYTGGPSDFIMYQWTPSHT